MVITPPAIFDLLFYAGVFLFGLDFSISGLLVLQANSANLKKPRLVGLWIIQRMSFFHDSTNRFKLFPLIYSRRNMAIQTLLSGALLIISSLIMMVDIGLRLL